MSDNDFASDISPSVAIAAYSGTSHSPETRAASVIKEYAASLQATHDLMSESAAAGGTTDLMQAEFERFRAGYRTRFIAWLSSRSLCISSMIAGPSNFPTRRAEKRNDVADRRLGELIDFERRARASACRTLRPDLRPIMAGDADAIDRLESEISTAERVQGRMKLANLNIRKHSKMGSTDQIGALIEMGYSDLRAQQLIKPDCCGRVGFPDYALTNNSANIRRMKQRLAKISAAREQPQALTDAGQQQSSPSADDIEYVEVDDGSTLEAELFCIAPGDWIAKDASDDTRRGLGSTRADALAALVDLANDALEAL